VAQMNVTIPDDLLARVHAARGDVPLTRWVQRALEERLARPAHQYENPSDLVIAEVPAGTKPAEPMVDNKVADQGAGDPRRPAAERGSAGDSSPPAPRAQPQVTPNFKGGKR
jgi:hypothetical protein